MTRRKSEKKKKEKKKKVEKKKPKQEERVTVSVEMTARQRGLVTAHLAAPPGVLELLRAVPGSSDSATISVPYDAVEDFIDAVEEVLPKIDDQSDRIELIDLTTELEAAYSDAVPDEEIDAMLPEGFDEDLDRFDRENWAETETFKEVIGKIQADTGLSDEDIEVYVKILKGELPEPPELMGLLAKISYAMGDKPREDLCGLTWPQFLMLDTTAWDEETGVLVLDEALDVSDLEALPIFGTANSLLLLLSEIKKIKLRANMTLGETLVTAIFNAGPPIDNGEIPGEEERHQLAGLFDLCGLAFELMGFVKVKGTTVAITRSGRDMTASENAGLLYSLLFRAMIGRLGGEDEEGPWAFSPFERHIPYFLFVLSTLREDWHDVEEMKSLFVPPPVHLGLLQQSAEDPAVLLLRQLFVPLEGFGLLEVQGEEEFVAGEGSAEFRKTPLFDRFIDFQFEEFDYEVPD